VRITLQELRNNGCAWHQAFAVGKFMNGRLEIAPDEWKRIAAECQAAAVKIMETAPVPIAVAKTAEQIERAEAHCAKCDWNRDWICEHIGCLPCKQRQAGGLRAQIRQPGTRCPALLW
jgi:hypothetical protein